MKIKILSNVVYKRTIHKAGNVVDLPKADANLLIESKFAEENKEPAPEKAKEPKP